MRAPADAQRLRRFLRELAQEADADAAVYLTGGATAVLLGWRDTTIDADILIVPEQDALYRALPRLKEELLLNVEIASPAHFIPELPGWRERSLLIERRGFDVLLNVIRSGRCPHCGRRVAGVWGSD